MNSRWGQVLAVFAAVMVVVVGIVIVVTATNSEPETDPLAATTTTRTTTTERPKPTLTVDSGCRQGRGPDRLVDVPQPVTDRVNRVWERIERWLAANAPLTAATLAPPASAEKIAEMQRKIGVPIPAELVASLRRHDGAGTDMRAGFTLPPFYLPISTEWITSNATMMCEVLVSAGIDGNVGNWWHGQLIPIAIDGGGGNLLLDQRPGRGGRLGEHFEDSDLMFTTYPETLTELLELTAGSLETGNVVLGHNHPKITDGMLEWDIR